MRKCLRSPSHFWRNVQTMVITSKFVLSNIHCGLCNSKLHVNFMTRWNYQSFMPSFFENKKGDFILIHKSLHMFDLRKTNNKKEIDN